MGMPPSQHISIDRVVRAVKSFAVGTGRGPDGLRADHLHAFIGAREDVMILLLYKDFFELLANGMVPTRLRPWIGGGK